MPFSLGMARRCWTIAFAAAFSLWPIAAFAHVEAGNAGGFLTGLLHPVSGLDHVLAMIAVGLWGAQLGTPAVWLLPIAFPTMMAIGGLLALLGVGLGGVEIGIAISSIVLGALILGEIRMPVLGALLIVGFFAVFHGHAHNSELEPGQNAMLYSLGFVIATGTLHTVGIGLGTVHRYNVGRLVLRVGGALVVCAGLYFLWHAAQ